MIDNIRRGPAIVNNRCLRKFSAARLSTRFSRSALAFAALAFASLSAFRSSSCSAWRSAFARFAFQPVSITVKIQLRCAIFRINMIDNIRRGPAIVENADFWRVAEPFSQWRSAFARFAFQPVSITVKIQLRCAIFRINMIDNIRRGPAIVGNADLWRVAEPFSQSSSCPFRLQTFFSSSFMSTFSNFIFQHIVVRLKTDPFFPTHRDQTYFLIPVSLSSRT